jgi:Mn2+/Fe2+ NRAMP family transporter
MVLIIYLPYDKFVNVLKYLCLALLLYIIVPFLTGPDWKKVFRSLVVPTLSADRNFIGMLVAILGTTISPYLFFWQTAMEVEDVKAVKRQIMVNKRLISVGADNADPQRREKRLMSLIIQKMGFDVNMGMLLSNLIMFFIILTAGTALYNNGIRKIDTVEQAAKALQPVAGNLSYLLFAVGVIGTGFIAIPVLSGCMSYIVSEAFGWKGSLDKKFHQAKGFYAVIIVALLLGLSLNYLGINPVQALIYTAILYGLTSPVIIAIVLHLANNKKIMGDYTNSRLSNFLGVLTFMLMFASAVYLIYLQFTDAS